MNFHRGGPGWKAGPSEEGDLWRRLAQICVGLTHAARGNSVGAVRLIERGAARLEEYDAGGGSTYGLDLTAVVTCAREHTCGNQGRAVVCPGGGDLDGGCDSVQRAPAARRLVGRGPSSLPVSKSREASGSGLGGSRSGGPPVEVHVCRRLVEVGDMVSDQVRSF